MDIDTTSVIFYYIILPLLLPFIIGLVTMLMFWKDELGRVIGFFVFKPVIAYPIWFWIAVVWLNQATTHIKALDSLLLLLPGLILTIIIVYPFRHLFYQHRLAWLFLIGDILRWGNSWLLASSGLGIPDIKSSMVNVLIWCGFIYPSIYAIVALSILLIRRRTRTKSAMEKEFV